MKSTKTRLNRLPSHHHRVRTHALLEHSGNANGRCTLVRARDVVGVKYVIHLDVVCGYLRGRPFDVLAFDDTLRHDRREGTE